MSKEKTLEGYMMNRIQERKKFNCANCSKPFNIEYDENNTPVSLWCKNCRATEYKIKTEFKMKVQKRKKDPYIALAQMKILLDRTQQYWEHKDNKKQYGSVNLYAAGSGLNTSADILADIDKILKKAKIPSKYLIAESLD